MWWGGQGVVICVGMNPTGEVQGPRSEQTRNAAGTKSGANRKKFPGTTAHETFVVAL
jgi:hypothetical protein